MASARRAVGPVGDPARATRWERAWRPFWALPAAIAVASVLLGLALPELDKRLGADLPILFGGGPASARGLLSTIASAMISVTGLVFSITMVVLQLASSQFSPRLLGGFLSSRTTQLTLGIFTASFTYALTVLRSVRSDGDSFVPQLSVSVAFALVLASVAIFLAFIHHITTSIQVSTMIERIAARTLDLVDEPPPPEESDDADRHEVTAGPLTWQRPEDAPVRTVTTQVDRRVIESVGYSRLVDHARDLDAVIVLRAAVGQMRHRGMPLLDVVGGDPDADLDQLRNAFGFARERSLMQDPLFGVRQLVDIAERALSPGINDPTTAVQVVDALHGILRRAGSVPDRSPYLLDDDGTVRLVDRPVQFDELLDLAVDEVAHYGHDTPPVRGRLLHVLDDLRSHVRPEFAAAVALKRDTLATSPG